MAFLLVKEHSEYGLPAWAHAKAGQGGGMAAGLRNINPWGVSTSADIVASRVQVQNASVAYVSSVHVE